MNEKSVPAQLFEGLAKLSDETNARILASARSNLERGMGNWVDLLIVANAAKGEDELGEEEIQTLADRFLADKGE